MGHTLAFLFVMGLIIWAAIHFDVAAKVKDHFVKPAKEKDPDAPSKIPNRRDP